MNPQLLVQGKKTSFKDFYSSVFRYVSNIICNDISKIIHGVSTLNGEPMGASYKYSNSTWSNTHNFQELKFKCTITHYFDRYSSFDILNKNLFNKIDSNKIFNTKNKSQRITNKEAPRFLEIAFIPRS